jgi:phospholipid/cholesterol/gamma-HCH transport system substrate-binding protein
MDTAISQVNENVQFMTELMRATLDKKTLASLKQSIDNLQQVTQTLAANNQKLRSIIMNTEHASSQFKPLLESSNDTVRALQTQLLPEAFKALANMDNLSRSLGNVAGRVNRNPSLLIRGSAPPPPGPGEADGSP